MFQRAAQIRSMPFSGESSSDSSDNEDAGDVSMTTGDEAGGVSGLPPGGTPKKTLNQGITRAVKRGMCMSYKTWCTLKQALFVCQIHVYNQ